MEETDMVAHFSVSGVARQSDTAVFCTVFCPAKAMGPRQRQNLAVRALAAAEPVCRLAAEHGVSRKFVSQQVDCAEAALQQAFAPESDGTAEVLFHLPVTKDWIEQATLALMLCCHSSLRGACEFFRDVLDFPISVGKVHNVLQQAVQHARATNDRQDLSAVRIGAHDEIFQSGQPVLVGADVDSTYCYLLSLEEHRDADTWGLRLLELQDQGFAPQATIADAGRGLRAGQALALPDVSCRGDVFHALQQSQSLATLLENRAYEAIAARDELERQKARRARQGQRTSDLSPRIASARRVENEAVGLAADVAVLVDWLRRDILSLAGPDHAMRCELFNFVVDELRQRATLGPRRIGAVARALSNQRDDLLAFAAQLDEDLAGLARQCQLPVATLREMFNTLVLDQENPTCWTREAALRDRLGGRFEAIRVAVAALAKQTVRASSVIENLNSRLRSYFFLRRHLGPDYLALLQFFLNHRRFPRSERVERIGKSPTELLTGQSHPHWLEMLGYERFRRN
jgi:hypothetical protein